MSVAVETEFQTKLSEPPWSASLTPPGQLKVQPHANVRGQINPVMQAPMRPTKPHDAQSRRTFREAPMKPNNMLNDIGVVVKLR